MAEMFIEQMSGEWQPDEFTDQYRIALEELVEAKLSGVELPEAEPAEEAGGQVVDLMAALRASVEAAKKRKETTGQSGKDDQGEPAEKPASRKRKAS